MEADTVDLEDYERILDLKLNPISIAIEKLERQQERITDILSDQKVILKSISDIERTMSSIIKEKKETHDDLYKRIRQCEMSEGNKLWDIVKIFAAGLFGGAVAWLVGNR